MRSARATSCGCGSASAARGAGDPRGIADFVLAPFEADEDSDALVERGPTRYS